MTVKLTAQKVQEIIDLCTEVKVQKYVKIRQVAKVIGKLVAAMPAVQYGRLYYRQLEIEKTLALRKSKGNFNNYMRLSTEAQDELNWWINMVGSSSGAINRGNSDLELETDASGSGWGGTDGNVQIGGRWNEEEAKRAENNEINFLELKAIYLVLQSLCNDMSDIHIKIKSDNTTAVAYVNHMGGTKSPDCNKLAREIWQWAIQRNIWLSACHLPGVFNVIADDKSRNFDDHTEWMLNKDIFSKICEIFGTPEIDLFASRLNAQLPRYVSWKPDPGAEEIDALSIFWDPEILLYAFPPFCLIGKCLQKISIDQSEVLIVVPKWPTQTWFSMLLHMLVDDPLILPRSKNILYNTACFRYHSSTK